MSDLQKRQQWVSIWGNAVSVAENRPERYAKNITIRYPILVPFSGTAVRLTFDNYCGTEPITIDKTTVMINDCFYPVLFSGGQRSVSIGAGSHVVSDPVDFPAVIGESDGVGDGDDGRKLLVSFYLKDFTQMRSVVFARGPLSHGLFANGDETENNNIDIRTSRKTNLFYFLSNVSLFTDMRKQSVICFGDSITSQNWPDELILRCRREGFKNTAIIRRATSGSRILRQYDSILYESYGLSGANRFPHEIPMTDGAKAVIIQQGINDIIHPVGEKVNAFRPMSDLPTVDELIDGLKYYIALARSYGLKVYVGTLLPMGGWRTDAPFRQEMRHAFNDFIRTTDLIDGCIDFDRALRDPHRPDWFLPKYDAGDHLHPSAKGYKRMAMEIPREVLEVPSPTTLKISKL